MNFKIFAPVCIINGRVHKFVCFDEAARIYEFIDPEGSWWTVSSEAFDKGILINENM
jgi:hypothetical protein